MKQEKKRTRGRKILKRLMLVLAVLAALSIVFGLSFAAYLYHHIDYSADEALFEMAKGERVTRLYYQEESRPVEWEEQRLVGRELGMFCAYSDIPSHLKNAFVAIEDKRFFEHEGVDWWRTCKAALNYLLHFDGRFGGSSITQQLIKNISSDNDLTLSRKAREICRAIHLEKNHSKEEILELYMNIAPMSGGCVGVGAAARLYYGKEVGELTLSECASIAAVTNSPVRYDPLSRPDENKKRRDLILYEMWQQGMIEEGACRAAQGEPIVTNGGKMQSAPIYSWYTEAVISDVIADLSREYGLSRSAAETMLFSGGLQIYTQMNKEAQEYLEAYFGDYQNFPTAFRNGLHMSMTVTDPLTGDLLAVVGDVGRKTKNRIFHYATDAKRPPGSSVKPLSVYAPALEEGVITSASVFDDVPVSFSKRNGRYVAWPHNLPAVYSGLTDLSRAVALSKNTVAVRVLDQLGVERSYAYLSSKLGISTLVRSRETGDGARVTDLARAPLALGQLTDGVSLHELTNAYGALASGGVYHSSRSYSVVLDRHGKVLLSQKRDSSRVFSPETAFLMTELLRGVAEDGTAASLTLKNNLPVAVKTGTSNNACDKWLVGYTPYAVAGVWCGYEDGSASIPSGAEKTHMQTWDAVMSGLHRAGVFGKAKRTNVFSAPSTVTRVAYCRDSGCLPCEACRADPRGERIAYGYFLRGTEPKTVCTRHVLVPYDEVGRGIATDACPKTNQKQVGLLSKFDRNFPAEVYIEDAQFEYDPRDGNEGTGEAGASFHGKSRVKEGEEFNRTCPVEHRDMWDIDRKDPFGWFRRYFKKEQKSS